MMNGVVVAEPRTRTADPIRDGAGKTLGKDGAESLQKRHLHHLGDFF